MNLVCETCNKSFEYHRHRKNCLECTPKRRSAKDSDERRKRNSEKVKKRRNKLKDLSIEYKGGKCMICGYSKCKGALEFHHLDPSEKDFGISSNGNIRSWEAIKHELDKCIMVCANCHREIHANLIDINGL